MQNVNIEKSRKTIFLTTVLRSTNSVRLTSGFLNTHLPSHWNNFHLKYATKMSIHIAHFNYRSFGHLGPLRPPQGGPQRLRFERITNVLNSRDYRMKNTPPRGGRDPYDSPPSFIS